MMTDSSLLRLSLAHEDISEAIRQYDEFVLDYRAGRQEVSSLQADDAKVVAFQNHMSSRLATTLGELDFQSATDVTRQLWNSLEVQLRAARESSLLAAEISALAAFVGPWRRLRRVRQWVEIAGPVLLSASIAVFTIARYACGLTPHRS